MEPSPVDMHAIAPISERVKAGVSRLDAARQQDAEMAAYREALLSTTPQAKEVLADLALRSTLSSNGETGQAPQ